MHTVVRGVHGRISCCSVSGTFTIRQSAFSPVPYDCGTWEATSKAAYIRAAASVGQLSQVTVQCQAAGPRRLRLLISGRTGSMSLLAARSLAARLNAAVANGGFRREVLQLAGGAAPPFAGDGSCVAGMAAGCPPGKPA